MVAVEGIEMVKEGENGSRESKLTKGTHLFQKVPKKGEEERDTKTALIIGKARGRPASDRMKVLGLMKAQERPQRKKKS